MSGYPIINPADVLPRPEAIDTSTQVQLRADWVAKMAELLPSHDVAELRSDPGGISADALSFLLLEARKHINDVYRAGLLACAVDTDLDILAAGYGLKRIVYAAATQATAAVVELDDALRLRCWTTMQRWSLGSSPLGVEGSAWPLALDDASGVRAYDFPGQGRMRCVLLPRPGLDAAGAAALRSRVSQGLMRRSRRPGSVPIDTVLAEVLTLDIGIALGVLPGASGTDAAAAAQAAVGDYLARSRQIAGFVALSRVEGDACVTNAVYAHVSGMSGDLRAGPDQAYQVNVTVTPEVARG